MNNLKVLIILISLFLFMNGYHSLDLYYNYHNLAVADKTISGIIIDIDSVYHNGIKQILISILLLISINFIKEKHPITT
jgi:hypothetical protein